jgi:hypothetical protein
LRMPVVFFVTTTRHSHLVDVLGSVCKLKPEQNGGDRQHGFIVGSSLFIAGGNPTKVLQAVNQPLNPIPLTIDLFVKRTTTMFIDPARNRVTNPSSAQEPTKLIAALAFVSHHTLWTAARTTPPDAFDLALFHQSFRDA